MNKVQRIKQYHLEVVLRVGKPLIVFVEGSTLRLYSMASDVHRSLLRFQPASVKPGKSTCANSAKEKHVPIKKNNLLNFEMIYREITHFNIVLLYLSLSNLCSA